MKIDYEEYQENATYYQDNFVLCKCCEFYYDHEDSATEELNMCRECSEIEDIEPEEEKDYWNLLSDDLKLKIFHINKEAERREWKVNIYPWLDGKIKIVKSPQVKTYYWINCVSCGVDTSYRKAKNYHWCAKCFDKYGRHWNETTAQYERRMRRVIESGDTTPLKTSRPIMISNRDKCPLIIDDSLVQVPVGDWKVRYAFLEEYALLEDSA
tara:strand:- start:1135 stop:1767 length:633 start_codon:yes stop_codon:yes gene_type:complete